MKAIINGKRYNTETAEHIFTSWNGLSSCDFRYVREELYRTKKGSWFIAGEGGAMSSYSRPVGNMTGGGEEIRPMTPDQVYDWLENENEHTLIEKYFSNKIKDA